MHFKGKSGTSGLVALFLEAQAWTKTNFENLILDDAQCNVDLTDQSIAYSACAAQHAKTLCAAEYLSSFLKTNFPFLGIWNLSLLQMTMNSLGNFNPANDPESMVSIYLCE